ncbi:MAG TPA: HAD family phosphatase [Gemmatimonadaceae bacterium]|jgi:HAD superfamily hydrolase (TIGR01509 family)|nr:HAD family phosphatase [Gemmatimonadaceae bacterium]
MACSVDAALLEIEGVLFDTRAIRRSTLQDALREHGLATPVEPDLVDGLAPRDAAAAALRRSAHTDAAHDEVLLDLVRASAERLFASHLSTAGVALCPGALDFVRESAAMTRLTVVTRARRDEAQALLRLASLDEFISTVVTADDVADAKPSAEGHRRAIERLSRQRPVDERSVIVVDDSSAGIRSAHAGGLRCIAVGPLPAHVAVDADAYVESLVGHTVRTLELLSRPGRERVQ